MRTPTRILSLAALAGAGLFTLASASVEPDGADLTVRRLGDHAASSTFARVDTSGAADANAAATVSQKEKTFAPTKVQVRTGDAVAILNDDDVVHNVYCRAGEFKYNSGPQQPGLRSVITFSAAGVYEVRCAIHPKMLLTVEVQD